MATVTQIAAGSSTTATTTVTFAAQAAGAVLLLLHVASDAYMADPGPSGWTLLESYQGNLGHYLYWKVSTGETSVAYTLSSAASSAHAVTAIAGVTATAPQSAHASTDAGEYSTGTSPSLTLTAGAKLVIAVLAGTGPNGRTVAGWTDSYVEVHDQSAASGDWRPSLAVAYRELAGGAATSTTGTFTPVSSQVSAIAAAFQVGEATTPLQTPVVTLVGQAAPSTAGATDGTITVSWPAVPNATRYEVGIASGHGATSGFTQVAADATSPHVVTGRSAGDFTVAVRAHPAA